MTTRTSKYAVALREVVDAVKAAVAAEAYETAVDIATRGRKWRVCALCGIAGWGGIYTDGNLYRASYNGREFYACKSCINRRGLVWIERNLDGPPTKFRYAHELSQLDPIRIPVSDTATIYIAGGPGSSNATIYVDAGKVTVDGREVAFK